MTPVEVAQRLEVVEELRFQAFDVALQLIAGEAQAETFSAHAAQIELLLETLEEHTQRVRRMVERCLQLRAIPGKELPAGF
ncbi:MAG: hypothetical protein JXA21_11405 [Anaerolineae bacterium]|nr:hypothetical protein [Anaerolineae bacterium]